MNLWNPHVVEQEETCSTHPVQYEGRLDSGEHFYFRYRHGWAQLGVGATVGEAIAQTRTDGCAEMAFGDSLQGVFNSDEDLNAVFDRLLTTQRRRIGRQRIVAIVEEEGLPY